MLQIAPKCPEMPRLEQSAQVLSPEQVQAVELLLIGESVTETVRKLRIDRKTLYRWRQSPHFRAEFNRRQAEAMEARGQRLRSLSEKAIGVIERHLDEGSLKAATALLKLVAAMPLPDTEANPQTLLQRQSEEILWAYWHRQPFAEKRYGRHSLNNTMFTEFCDEVNEFIARRYGLEFGSEVDDILNEMQAEARS